MLAAAAVTLAVVAPPGTKPAGDVDPEARHCLAQSMYWEARNEGRPGMLAVGHVVLNRMASDEFPDDPCGVVYEGGETPPCQFSWWCDGRSDEPTEPEPWALALELAGELLSDPPADPTDGALFFHHEGIDVPWVVDRQRTTRIEGHIYYR